jgi:anti-sigma factor RsiW
MTCREFVELIRAQLDNELDFNDDTRFDQHISVCSKCAAYLDGYRQTIAATRKAFSSPHRSDEDSDLPEDLVEQIMNSKRSFPSRVLKKSSNSQ